MNRRSFLQTSAAGLAAPVLARAQSKRPNVLFCISDDQSYPHASVYGATWLKTPAFDRIAREGALFHNAFVSTPSCCPSRGSVLAGQDFYRLREASMNHTIWPRENDIPLYTDLLAAAGYHVGYTGKGWAPGVWQNSGRTHSPTGPVYNDARLTPPGDGIADFDYAANFETFLCDKNEGQPFCFWAGWVEPHRIFEDGIGKRHGKKPKQMEVPEFFPDSPEVRSDVADYAFEIEYYDSHLGRMLQLLEDRGELDDTIIVCTSDNGMAFPRAKATLYDFGARMPFAVRWGNQVEPGRVIQDFVSFADLAPTFLEAAGESVPAEMTGRSLMPVLKSPLSGQIDPDRRSAVFGIERHLPGSRPEGAGYPMRAIRTPDYLYVRNLQPEKNPVGDNPGIVWPDDDPTGGFGDTDGSPTKTYMWTQRDQHPELAELAFGKRPAEELYDVRRDRFDLTNLAADPDYAEVKDMLSAKLDRHLKRTQDPRVSGDGGALFERIMKEYPVLGANSAPRETGNRRD